MIKLGHKILVPNCICFDNRSEAICAAISFQYNEKSIEKMDGHFPNEYDMASENWKDEKEYEIKDFFTLDDITIVQIKSINRLLWVWKYKIL